MINISGPFYSIFIPSNSIPIPLLDPYPSPSFTNNNTISRVNITLSGADPTQRGVGKFQITQLPKKGSLTFIDGSVINLNVDMTPDTFSATDGTFSKNLTYSAFSNGDCGTDSLSYIIVGTVNDTTSTGTISIKIKCQSKL